MKIVFIGAVDFSRFALEKLISMGVRIDGVCTVEKSDFNADHYDLRGICEENGIPWTYVTDINSEESIQRIEGKQSDVVFCFG